MAFSLKMKIKNHYIESPHRKTQIRKSPFDGRSELFNKCGNNFICFYFYVYKDGANEKLFDFQYLCNF